MAPIKVGPWGGWGGDYWDDGCYGGVREIIVVYGGCIDSVRFLYDKHGKPVLGNRHGGSGGNFTAQICLNFPEEHLVAISGHFSPYGDIGTPVIRSLTFITNRRTFGPYGVIEGTPFYFSLDGGSVVGFRGRSGQYLDSLGCNITSGPNLFDKMHFKLQKKVEEYAYKSFGHRPHQVAAP